MYIIHLRMVRMVVTSGTKNTSSEKRFKKTTSLVTRIFVLVSFPSFEFLTKRHVYSAQYHFHTLEAWSCCSLSTVLFIRWCPSVTLSLAKQGRGAPGEGCFVPRSTWLCRKIWGGFFWRNLNTELSKMMQIARRLKNWDACAGSWV